MERLKNAIAAAEIKFFFIALLLKIVLKHPFTKTLYFG